MIRRTVLLLVSILALVLSGCGSSADDSDGASSISTDLGVAPQVPASDGEPPTELVTTDVVEGDGATATDGSMVEVKYVGAFYETGEEFDSSWSRGDDETLPFTVGVGQVIPGFEQGVEGMQAGGRRAIVIPSDLGYGPTGQGPIPGGSTLVFVVDLVSVS